MKVPFLSFVLLATLLSGCQGAATVEDPVVDSAETVDPVNSDPVETSAYGNLELYTSEEDWTFFESP